ncbi:hypothetical protein [Sorangium sp. So ce406]|uniref:hypothetical protein n=1 Tax=Sorangium sp. So ce406 TaxID=3133311 RepID=UPI003F5BAE87
MSDPLPFNAVVPEDPAVPGDPFVRLRYHYGMLLGAEDFSVEQRERVLRRRLHHALLHGAGTVYGLRVVLGDPDTEGRRTRVIVRPGLAVDALGREIYVDQDQCLDVAALARHAIWAELKAPDGTVNGTIRRAYVVLRYEACQADPVPAIAPACDGPGDTAAYSRLLDRFHIELSASPPADPHALQRAWLSALLSAAPTRSPRDVLLDFLMNVREPPAPEAPPLSSFWRKPDSASLLLAVVDLDQTGAGDGAAAFAVDAPGNPDNAPRALLPSAQLAAESLLGERLLGAPLAATPLSRPFQVTGWTVASATQLRVHLSGAPHAAIAAAKPLALAVLSGSGWTDLTADVASSADGSDIVLDIGNGASLGDGTAGVTYQIHVRGEGPMPLVSDQGAPLAGVLGDPITRAGRGRDVSIIDTWKV